MTLFRSANALAKAPAKSLLGSNAGETGLTSRSFKSNLNLTPIRVGKIYQQLTVAGFNWKPFLISLKRSSRASFTSLLLSATGYN